MDDTLFTICSLNDTHLLLSKIEDWNVENIKDELNKLIEMMGWRGLILHPLRVALSGKKHSASPWDIAGVLGKDETLKRIKTAVSKLEKT